MAFSADRSLLNPNFDGYKLAEDSLTSLQQSFNGGVHQIILTGSGLLTYQRVRQATMCNHLFQDPWDGFRVYWCTAQTQQILCATILASGELVISAVHHSNQPIVDTPSTNASLIFFSSSHALFYQQSYTNGHLVIFDTNDRSAAVSNNDTPPQWQVLVAIPLTNQNVTLDSAHLSADRTTLDFLTIELGDTPSAGACRCTWMRAEFSCPLGSGNIEDVDQTQFCELNIATVPVHTEFIGEYLMILSESAPTKRVLDHEEERVMTNPSVNIEEREEPVDQQQFHGMGYQDESKRQQYQWTQTHTDVTVSVSLSEDVSKSDISCVIERDSLVIGLTDGTTYVRGELYNQIDTETSTWIFTKQRIEVVLEKLVPDQEWPSLLNDGSVTSALPLQEGLETDHLSAEEMAQLQERLTDISRKRLSSGEEQSSSKQSKPIFQSPLEDCDTEDDTEVTVYILSVNGDLIQKIGTGGKQTLFTLPSSSFCPSVISLRHDIDALMFSPSLSPSSPPLSFTHTATFNALAYVQASKKDKKFLSSTADSSLAVLCNSSRHIFIYCQPVGGVKGHTALQYVHTLTDNSGILGVQLSKEGVVFVLTDNLLTVLKLP